MGGPVDSNVGAGRGGPAFTRANGRSTLSNYSEKDSPHENQKAGRTGSLVTKSEALFVELCEVIGWAIERLSEAGPGIPNPDFLLQACDGTSIVVEIKQFDPNREEREELEKLEVGGLAQFSTKPGKRVRKAIKKATPQVKARGAGSTPAMLVVFDATGFRIHDDPYAILTAMRGLDVVPVLRADDTDGPVKFGNRRPGPEKRMTANMHTSISGIAALRQTQNGLSLDIYHNDFAKCPINSSALIGARVRHWRMRRDEMEWEPC